MTQNQSTGISLEELIQRTGLTNEGIEKRKGIKQQITMPLPDGKPVTIRFLWSKDDITGKPVVFIEKSIEKFKGGTGRFAAAELYDNPGERQLNLTAKSLVGAIAAALREKGLGENDLPGKVGDISASWFNGAPLSDRGIVCPRCAGKGCLFCTVKGSKKIDDNGKTNGKLSVVYNFVFRDDLMTVVGKGGSAASQFD